MKQWIFIAVLLGMVFTGCQPTSAPEPNDTSTTANREQAAKQKQPSVPAAFEGECPVNVTFEITDNIINYPEVHCSFTNLTDKDIAAIQLHFVPLDVYGEEIDNWVFTQNKLYTDAPIPAHGSDSRSWQLLDQKIKMGNLYIYSVYFSDGTEWGDRNASETTIKKYGHLITME